MIARPLLALLVLFTATLQCPAHAASAEDAAAAENLTTKFYPISRATIIKIAGIDRWDSGGSSAAPSPFALGNNKTGKFQREEEQYLAYFFKENGITLTPDTLAYDGSQLIVTTTAANHQIIRDTLRAFDETRMVEIKLWLEEEVLKEGDKQPSSVAHLPQQITLLSGKTGNIVASDGSCQFEVTPIVEYDDSISFQLKPLFLVDGAHIRTEVTLLNGATMRVAALRTEEGTLKNDQRKASTSRELKVYLSAKLVSPDGEHRPLDYSPFKALNFPDDTYEVEFFPISRATMIKMTGFNLGSPDSSMDEKISSFFERKGISFEDQNTMVFFDGSQLIIQQTPEALAKIRDILYLFDETKQVRQSTTLERVVTKPGSKSGRYFTTELEVASRSGKTSFLTLGSETKEGERPRRITCEVRPVVEDDNSVSSRLVMRLIDVDGFPDFDYNTESTLFSKHTLKLAEIIRTLPDTAEQETITAYQRTALLDIKGEEYDHNRFDPQELITEFYPISRANAIRMTGYMGKNINSHADAGSPFMVPTDPVDDYGLRQEDAIRSYFERKDVDFQNVEGASLAYDGSQIIVTQTGENHKTMTDILRSAPFDETKQAYTHALLHDASGREVGSAGLLVLSTKTTTLVYGTTINRVEDAPFLNLSCTPIVEDDDSISPRFTMTTRGELFPEFLPFSTATEVSVFDDHRLVIATPQTTDNTAGTLYLTSQKVSAASTE